MKNLNLCKLPAYDSIDIVRICSSTANRVCQEMDDWLSLRCVRVDTPTRDRILELCRSLPPANSMRCHTPPVGLRFYKDQNLRLAFSICWACNNAFGERNGKPIVVRFDGKSTIAIELFSIVQGVVGADILGDSEIQ